MSCLKYSHLARNFFWKLYKGVQVSLRYLEDRPTRKLWLTFLNIKHHMVRLKLPKSTGDFAPTFFRGETQDKKHYWRQI